MPIKAVLEQIKEIQRAEQDGGVIHGVVKQSWASPFPNVGIEARGANGVYKATSNKGEFEIKVPVGRYVVGISNKTYSKLMH